MPLLIMFKMKNKKPWGSLKQLMHKNKLTINLMVINPFQATSFHLHKTFSEKLFFITPGHVQIGDRTVRIGKEETVLIKNMQKHRIFAKNSRVVVLETIIGDFDKKDKIILSDYYGRK
jgi:mannose-6-phosphate isomerase-like protein (cupin superfamily)